jgi:hypothetical protein
VALESRSNGREALIALGPADLVMPWVAVRQAARAGAETNTAFASCLSASIPPTSAKLGSDCGGATVGAFASGGAAATVTLDEPAVVLDGGHPRAFELLVVEPVEPPLVEEEQPLRRHDEHAGLAAKPTLD